MDTIAGKKIYKELENLVKGTFFEVKDVTNSWEWDRIEIVMNPDYCMTNIFDKQIRNKSDNFLDNVEKIVKKYGFKTNRKQLGLSTYYGPDIDDYFCILAIEDISLNESDNSLMESFNGFASDYINLNESLNLRPALNKIKNICARLQKEFGLDCYATEDEVTFNNDDDIMSNLVVGKKYNSLKQYLVNVIQIMKLCGRRIMFNTQYDYNSILV